MPGVITPTRQNFAPVLLAWYARGHRPMPWREESNSSPYHIWLAEIMLQQTTVAAVIPYYQRFLQAFPTVQALAQADIQQILNLWQGLGYYRRAHLLHACAQAIVTQHNGSFPSTETQLLTLPGLGPYTAAVIAATAFNTPSVVVDGNVERVISRLFRIATPLPAAKKPIREKATQLASHTEPRLYANAIMELGSQICTPTNPQCLLCPVSQFCEAFAAGNPTNYPVKPAKKALPHHHATAYLLTMPNGTLYLQQRPATGLLASLWELPHTGWEPSQKTPPALPPFTNPHPAGSHTHTFTHFKLTLNLIRADISKIPSANAFQADALPPLSTLMRKALSVATATTPANPPAASAASTRAKPPATR